MTLSPDSPMFVSRLAESQAVMSAANAIDISPSSVQGHIDHIIRDGLLTRRDGRCRTLWANPAISADVGGGSGGQGDSAL